MGAQTLAAMMSSQQSPAQAGEDAATPAETSKVSGYLGLAGGLLSASADYAQGAAAKRAGQFNSKILLMQGKQAIATGNFQTEQIRREAGAVIGAQRVAAAGQGVDVNAGTAGALQEQTVRLSEEDVGRAKNNAILAAWGYRAEAAQEKLAGQQAYRAGITRSASSLLGSLSVANDAGLF